MFLSQRKIFQIVLMFSVIFGAEIVQADAPPARNPNIRLEVPRSPGASKQKDARKKRMADRVVRGQAFPIPTQTTVQPEVADRSQRPDLSAAPRVSRPTTRQFYWFPAVQSVVDRQELSQKLLLIDSSLKIADHTKFSESSPCRLPQNTCVIVAEKVLTQFQAAIPNLGQVSSVGMMVETVGPASAQGTNQIGTTIHPQNQGGNSSASSSQSTGAPRSTGFLSSFGTSIMSYYNPDPNVYYIPDGQFYPSGFSQYAGAWLPVSTAEIISPTAKVTNARYDINVYHPFPRDLVIDVGYDATPFAGPVLQVNQVVNRPTGLFSGYNTFTVNTSSFNGQHPDAYYYVNAYDVAGFDVGFINEIIFTIDWIDYPNLTFTGGNTFNNFNVSQNRFLSANNRLTNNSFVDITIPFAMGWYLEQDFSTAHDCTGLTYNPGGNSTWLAGYSEFGAFDGNSYTPVSLPSVDLDQLAANASGAFMPSGRYCLWAYADDLEQVIEWDEGPLTELNNQWDNIRLLGGFDYVFESFRPDLTFDYASSTNSFTYNQSGALQSQVRIRNASPTASTIGGPNFDLGWYLSPISGNSCDTVSLDLNTAYFVGAAQGLTAGAWQYLNASLPAGTNILNSTRPDGAIFSDAAFGGNYCLWAWVDDLDTVGEGTEDNNILVFNQPINRSAVSIEKIQKDQPTLTLFPNPASDWVTLQMPVEFQTSAVRIWVMNSAGQRVQEVPSGVPGPTVQLAISELPPGVYLVTVFAQNGKSVTARLIKSR